MSDDKMVNIVSLAKRRGFIFPSDEIYGGANGYYSYGPLGAQLKKNIRDVWWRDMVTCAPIHPKTRKPLQVVPFEGSIITKAEVLQASGHVDKFKDTFYHCHACKADVRDDEIDRGLCPKCSAEIDSEPRDYNLMFETESGVVEGNKTLAYLRPETAQGIFCNFANIANTCRVKLPFGVAQTGKAFRNEVTPRYYTFRQREFEQMEMEWFFNPEDAPAQDWFDFWVEYRMRWWNSLGIDEDNLSLVRHTKEELAHYAKDGAGVVDIMYKFPFGLGEIEGIAHRTNFDLKRHAEASGASLDFFDQPAEKRLFPDVIEPSAGLDRAVLAVLCDAYTRDESRACKEYMAIHPKIAPIKVAFFPLVKREGMPEIAQTLYNHYRRRYDCVYEESGSIGKRYARMDEIGTPFCITIDGETVSNDTVTVRNRDTGDQERMDLQSLEGFLAYLLW